MCFWHWYSEYHGGDDDTARRQLISSKEMGRLISFKHIGQYLHEPEELVSEPLNMCSAPYNYVLLNKGAGLYITIGKSRTIII